MRLFACMLLVTMVFTAMLIDHSEGFARRRYSRRRYFSAEIGQLAKDVKETRSLMDQLNDVLDEVDEQLDARAQELRGPEEQEDAP